TNATTPSGGRVPAMSRHCCSIPIAVSAGSHHGLHSKSPNSAQPPEDSPETEVEDRCSSEHEHPQAWGEGPPCPCFILAPRLSARRPRVGETPATAPGRRRS